jgi:predicted transposase YbfD/YdcC
MRRSQIIEATRLEALKKFTKKLYKLFGVRSISVIEHFSDLTDPRSDQGMRHDLINIVFIALCAVICGANGWAQIEEFGKAKEVWLKQFLKFPCGIPSEDTFRRVFAIIDPKEFQQRFSKWIQVITYVKTGAVVAIDGKTMRGGKGEGLTPKHIVSAWNAVSHLTLGQVAVKEKSNEITAIPELLQQLCITGCIVTIDAMGCQTKIALKIRESGADYVLALKGNQGTLSNEVDLYFQNEINNKKSALNYAETLEKGHDRIECRKCWVSNDLKSISNTGNWKDLTSIVRIESERVLKGKSTIEIRYYISSLNTSAERMLFIIRSHWGIENNVHWVLDVAFLEDECRIRNGNGPENFNVLRHIALTLLKREKTCKRGILAKRGIAGWNEAYLEKVLMCSEIAA